MNKIYGIIILLVVILALGFVWFFKPGLFAKELGFGVHERHDCLRNITSKEAREFMAGKELEVINSGLFTANELSDLKFEDVESADQYLRPSDFGLGVVVGGEAKFYPFDILAYHQVVNDLKDDLALVITYCPICGSGVVYESELNGTREEFGVSGKYFKSNMLIYDKETKSLWMQANGMAIKGQKTGEQLKLYQEFENITWADWKNKYPDTLILSRDTGFDIDYSIKPQMMLNQDGLVEFAGKAVNEHLCEKADQ